MRAVDAHPAGGLARPFVRKLREHVDAGANVFPHLGVMSGRRKHFERPVPCTVHVTVVEVFDRSADLRRIPSDFVERDQHVVAVKGGVFQPLRLHWPGGPLQAS